MPVVMTEPETYVTVSTGVGEVIADSDGEVALIQSAPELEDPDILWKALSDIADRCDVIAFRFTSGTENNVWDALQALLVDGDLTFSGENYVFSHVVDVDDEEEEPTSAEIVRGGVGESVEDMTNFDLANMPHSVDLSTLWEKFIYDTDLEPTAFEKWVQDSFPQHAHLLQKPLTDSGGQQQFTVPARVRLESLSGLRLAQAVGGLSEASQTLLATHRQLAEAIVRRLRAEAVVPSLARRWLHRLGKA